VVDRGAVGKFGKLASRQVDTLLGTKVFQVRLFVWNKLGTWTWQVLKVVSHLSQNERIESCNKQQLTYLLSDAGKKGVSIGICGYITYSNERTGKWLGSMQKIVS